VPFSLSVIPALFIIPMFTTKLQPAQWRCDEEGHLYAPVFGDTYASRSGAWGQADDVFIKGSGVAQRWQTQRCVRLLETGFGLGVNFLATWDSLRASSSNARLHYVAIEKHPFTREDLRTALDHVLGRADPHRRASLQALAERLHNQWPPMLAGFHALELDDQVTLTLVFADIQDALPALRGVFDIFFLDGFAPGRNPQMWSPALLTQLPALAAPAARVASWCVAGTVRRALVDAGFVVEKRPGFGGKRAALAAHWPVTADLGESPTEAIVIGAGIAGASVARQLARRGIAVTVIEQVTPAAGGSGNPVAIVRPELGAIGNPVTEITAAGASWLRRWINRHPDGVPHAWSGVLRIARDTRKHDKMAQLAGIASEEWLTPVAVTSAAQWCGWPTAADGFFLSEAGWVAPPRLVKAMLDHPSITLRSGVAVRNLGRHDQNWRVTLEDESVIETSLLMIATAFDTGLAPARLTMGRARGQLSQLPARADHPLAMVVCRDGYISPAVDGMHTIGATLQHDDEDTSARRADDIENFERLQRLLPDFVSDASQLSSGRVAWRATTQDRLPLVGKLAPGLYTTLGHGARGMTTAPLCAEFLAAMICDEPLPMGRDWVERLDPTRMIRDGVE
jgi:tRNA 5-methylaminomethyl-2-thiouridine biosynthesis bifunctional protein